MKQYHRWAIVLSFVITMAAVAGFQGFLWAGVRGAIPFEAAAAGGLALIVLCGGAAVWVLHRGRIRPGVGGAAGEGTVAPPAEPSPPATQSADRVRRGGSPEPSWAWQPEIERRDVRRSSILSAKCPVCSARSIPYRAKFWGNTGGRKIICNRCGAELQADLKQSCGCGGLALILVVGIPVSAAVLGLGPVVAGELAGLLIPGPHSLWVRVLTSAAGYGAAVGLIYALAYALMAVVPLRPVASEPANDRKDP